MYSVLFKKKVDCLNFDIRHRRQDLTSSIVNSYRLQRHTCHLQQHFFHISGPNKGTKGPENHSLG
jgi:hypothetical protein